MIAKTRNTSSSIRHRLTLQQELQTADGAGGYSRSWQDIACLWAEIAPLKGKEILFGEQMESKVTHKVTLRYRAGVTAAMRLVFEERVFNIRAVLIPDENKEILQLLVDEGVAA